VEGQGFTLRPFFSENFTRAVIALDGFSFLMLHLGEETRRSE
jgi:hypothetical protein